MVYELKKIIRAYQAAIEKDKTTVLATVVALDGSSYRRPGVRMLITSDGQMTGAVSGGCVEKEVLRQAQEVFDRGTPKMMTYDGRYRLGCEGILYILIEPFKLSDQGIKSFWQCVEARHPIEISSFYSLEFGKSNGLGSIFHFANQDFYTGIEEFETKGLPVFKQKLEPCHKLWIIGAEHDAVQLCAYAAMTGWEVAIVATPNEEKTIDDFPGATEFHNILAEDLMPSVFDEDSSVILMTHSYVKDLGFLISLKNVRLKYLGLLGPAARREKLLSEFMERVPDVDLEFVENIYGPAGLHLGSETPQEIAVSIVAEILSVIRQTIPIPLKDKEGSIHST